MDNDEKTLADLSREVQEKKYITLDVASKISGYTKDYLDRLCRLNKIEHRIWIKGGFVVELGSLLRETHTLLISGDEINYVDRRELAGQKEEDTSFSPLTFRTAPMKTSPVQVEIPITRISRETFPFAPVTPAAPKASPAPVPFQMGALPQVAAPSQTPPSAPKEPAMPLPAVQSPIPVSSTPALPVTSPVAPEDDWDALLFKGVDEIPEEPEEPKQSMPPPPSLYETPSQYRPIATSVDSAPHRDDAPLFPPLAQKPSESVHEVTPAPPSAIVAVSVQLPQVAAEHYLAVPASHALMEE